MRIIREPAELQQAMETLRRQGETVGLVPTMGALHEGHLSLCRRCSAENSVPVASIFVNPLQFGPAEDYTRYPRDLEADSRALETAGIQSIFAPEPQTIYPSGFQTYVEVEEIAKPLEGERRPGHFRGVATVVLKLFNLTGRCRAYFGEKDFQQLQLIRRMVRDLDIPVEVISLPTVREPDGLAMSSRNRYLSAEERRAALVIHQALEEARRQAQAGFRDVSTLLGAVERSLAGEPLLQPEYVAIVDPQTFLSLQRLEGEARLLTAVRLPSARLIDNVPIP